MNYRFEDLLIIAREQIALEESYAEAVSSPPGLLFIDTDMYVMKVWCEFVFGKCHPWILKQIAERHYDLYLLCKTDLPWIKDELREYPDPAARNRLYRIYKEHMISQDVPWVEIGGSYEERVAGSIKAVDALIAGMVNNNIFAGR